MASPDLWWALSTSGAPSDLWRPLLPLVAPRTSGGPSYLWCPHLPLVAPSTCTAAESSSRTRSVPPVGIAAASTAFTVSAASAAVAVAVAAAAAAAAAPSGALSGFEVVDALSVRNQSGVKYL